MRTKTVVVGVLIGLAAPVASPGHARASCGATGAPIAAHGFSFSDDANGFNIVTVASTFPSKSLENGDSALYVLGNQQNENGDYLVYYNGGAGGGWQASSTYLSGLYVDGQSNAYGWTGETTQETIRAGNVWTGNSTTWTQIPRAESGFPNFGIAYWTLSSVFNVPGFTNLFGNGAFPKGDPDITTGTKTPLGTSLWWWNPSDNDWGHTETPTIGGGLLFGTTDRITGQLWALSNDYTVWTYVSDKWVKVTTTSCTARGSSFIQIAAKNDVVYALDTSGVVWSDNTALNGSGGCWGEIPIPWSVVSISTDNLLLASDNGDTALYGSRSDGCIFSCSTALLYIQGSSCGLY